MADTPDDIRLVNLGVAAYAGVFDLVEVNLSGIRTWRQAAHITPAEATDLTGRQWRLDNTSGNVLMMIGLRVAQYPPLSLGRHVLVASHKTAVTTEPRLGDLLIFMWVWPVLSTQAQLDALSDSHGPYLLHLAAGMSETDKLPRPTICMGCGTSNDIVSNTVGRLDLIQATATRRALLQVTLFMGAVCRFIECVAQCWRAEVMLDRAASPDPRVLTPRRRRVCFACNVRETATTGAKFKCCSRCKCAYYCSEACQAANWPDHCVVCATVASLHRTDRAAGGRLCAPHRVRVMAPRVACRVATDDAKKTLTSAGLCGRYRSPWI